MDVPTCMTFSCDAPSKTTRNISNFYFNHSNENTPNNHEPPPPYYYLTTGYSMFINTQILEYGCKQCELRMYCKLITQGFTNIYS